MKTLKSIISSIWKHLGYTIKAYDSKGCLVCTTKTRNAISCGAMCQILESNGYRVTYTPYDEKLTLCEILKNSDLRVIRNLFITASFIVSMIFCYFKNDSNHTILKSGIVVWIVILLGWCISFILDNHHKMDEFTASASDVLLKFDDALEKGEMDKLLKENNTLEIKELFRLTLEQRKTFQKEIAVVLGGIGAIVGSATFLKFLGL